MSNFEYGLELYKKTGDLLLSSNNQNGQLIKQIYAEAEVNGSELVPEIAGRKTIFVLERYFPSDEPPYEYEDTDQW